LAHDNYSIQMKRIFIAHKVNPGENFTGMFNYVRSELAEERINWTVLENIHITLLFIGDTEEQKTEQIKAALKEIVIRSESFDIIIRGLGIFKNLSEPRIIWTGIDKCDNLTRLNKLILNRISEIVPDLEDRPYNPHITLGRIKNLTGKSKLKELTERYHNIIIQRQNVTEIILYESILKPGGPVYKPIEIYPLNF
jgi:RNA 2',3'-cyclic 3'-phosphodiesterase